MKSEDNVHCYSQNYSVVVLHYGNTNIHTAVIEH